MTVFHLDPIFFLSCPKVFWFFSCYGTFLNSCPVLSQTQENASGWCNEFPGSASCINKLERCGRRGQGRQRRGNLPVNKVWGRHISRRACEGISATGLQQSLQNSCANISSLVGCTLFSETIADAWPRISSWVVRRIVPENHRRSMMKKALL